MKRLNVIEREYDVPAKTLYTAIYFGRTKGAKIGGRWHMTDADAKAYAEIYRPRCPVPLPVETLQRFKAGEPVEVLARDYGVNRRSILKRLGRVGVRFSSNCKACLESARLP